MNLGDRTWPEVAAVRPLLVLPIGSTEQHGPHLPVDTDTRIAVAVAERVAARCDDVVVAPPIAITASGEHDGFAGTLSIGRAVLEEVLVELTRSADAFGGVAWLNAHGGNVAPIQGAAARLAAEGREVVVLDCWPDDGDPHAGHTETSMLLALSPEVVRTDLAAPGATDPWSDLGPRIRAAGVRSVSPSGVLGDPTTATAEAGHRIVDELVDRLTIRLQAWRPAPS